MILGNDRSNIVRLLPHGAVLFTSITLGGTFVATRYLMDGGAAAGAPASLAFMRYGLAALLLALVGFKTMNQRLSLRDGLAIMFIGLLQFGIFHLLINSALGHIPASRGAVIFALIPILTMIVAAISGNDVMTWRKMIAAIMAVAGVSLAAGEKAFQATGLSVDASIDWTGELFFLVAVCCGATYNALSGRYLRRHSVTTVSALAMSAGAAFLAFFSASEGLFQNGPGYDATAWWIFLYLTVPSGALAFFLFNWGLSRLTPMAVAIYVPFAPVSATILGALLLDEAMTTGLIAGLVCVAGAVLLANWRWRLFRG